MLEWRIHQENYGYAPGTSDPENLSGLQQQLPGQSCLVSIRSPLLWHSSHSLHSEASIEEAAVI